MNHTKCQKQAFWRHTVSAASAQTYSKDSKTFIVNVTEQYHKSMTKGEYYNAIDGFTDSY